jgi:hypothetical protein
VRDWGASPSTAFFEKQTQQPFPVQALLFAALSSFDQVFADLPKFIGTNPGTA